MSARVFFVGATVGAIVGGLAVFAFQTKRETPPVAGKDVPAATAHSETPPRSDAAPSQSPATVVPAPSRPQRTADVATTSSDPAPPAPGSAATVAPTSSADPGDEVLRMDAEMRARGESMEQLGDKMKYEARDDEWAPNMENELRDFLARRPVPNALGTTSVDCRSTVCRILSVVSFEAVAAMPMTDLQAAVGHLPDESLGREVSVISVSMGVDSKQPGQSIEVVFLRRADKPANARR